MDSKLDGISALADDMLNESRFCSSYLGNSSKFSSDEVRNLSAWKPSTKAPRLNLALSYYLAGPLLLCFIIFGLCGNALCLYILSRPKRRPRVNVYLMTLAGWDWILVASSFFVYNLPALAAGEGKSVWEWSVYVHALPFLYAVAAMAHNCSIWIVICLAVERYFALCHPLEHRLWWSGSWLRRALLLAISATGVLYSLPRLFETRIDSCADRETGKIILRVSESILQNNAYYRLWYKAVGGMALFSVGPTVTLLTLSIRVAVAMKSRGRVLEGRTADSLLTIRLSKRKCTKSSTNKFSSAEKRPSEARVVDSLYNTNVMLLVVVAKFLLCHSLPAVLDVCESTMGSGFHHNFLIDVVIDISNALVVFNSSCNVAIYYSCSRRFRYEFSRRLSTLARKCISHGKAPVEMPKINKGAIERP